MTSLTKELIKLINTPEGVYKNGKCVCEGYIRLYEYIGPKIGLKIYYLSGASKKEENLQLSFGRHAWNALEVKGNKYLIDATWGSGSIKENENKYTKELKEFYFCTNPEDFIFTHFPNESKWQLLESLIKNEEFEKTALFHYTFFNYFKKASELNYFKISFDYQFS